MIYSRYFKSGQKILLRLTEPPGRFEALTAVLQEGGDDYFDLALPYGVEGEERYPFVPQMPLELMSDHLGLGLRLGGRFREQLPGERIRVDIEGELQIFQRRFSLRADTTIGLRYTKGRGTLRSFRQQWEKNLAILDKTRDFASLPSFPRTPVNLSSGGLRFDLAPPVAENDLCLVLLQLEPASRPICAIAEVVWLQGQPVDGRRRAGMRFVAILETDQKRIETLVKERATHSEDPAK